MQRKLFINGLLLIILILVPYLTQGKEIITLDQSDVGFVQSLTSTSGPFADMRSIEDKGFPMLPTISYKYYITSDIVVSGITILKTVKEHIPGSYDIPPFQNELDLDMLDTNMPRNEVVYSSSAPYPAVPIEFAGIGFKRGHQIATVVVYPYEYIPATKELYFYSSLEFEFIYDSLNQTPAHYKRLDNGTIETIKNVVANDYDVPETYDYFQTAKAAHSMTIDSIPCVIITNLQMQPAFEEYAWWKTICGNRTEVMRVDVIDMLYPGDSIQIKIRNFIRDYYETKYTDYFLLGGDVDIIPGMFVDSQNDKVLTDLYYSNLDSTWNDDGDSLFGECEWRGDTVDYEPEVYVGRIPCNTFSEAQAVIDKLMTYQTDTSMTDYQTKILFISSGLRNEGDALSFNQDLDSLLSVEFTPTYCDMLPGDSVISEMENGYGIMVNYSHAQHPDNFLTDYIVGYGAVDPVYANEFDSLNTDGQYSIFFNNTCKNVKLDDTDYECLSRRFMLSPEGGGVGYIGSTYIEWSFSYRGLHKYMFGQIFDSNKTQICKVMTDAKAKLWTPRYNHTDDIYRYGMFAYMYLGDPQLEMWTEQPRKLRLYLSVDTVIAETTANISVIVIDEYDEPVSDALICLTKGYDGVYELAYTGDYGEVAFDNIYFPSAGTATVAARKSNCFPIVDSIEVISGGGGCPMLYVQNGTDYQFINNILAQSEDLSLPVGNYADYYPIYSIPLLDDNSIKIRIQEGGKEKSYFDQLALKYIYYPIDKQVAYTNKGEFKYISDNYLMPISAVTDKDEDVLDQIKAFDDYQYSSTLPGSIVVKYKCPDGIGKIGSEGGGGIEPPPGGKNPSKILADEVLNKNVVVSILDEVESWQTVDTHYPRVMKTGRFTDLSDYWSGSELTVKIEWNSDISIDCLPYILFEGDGIEQFEVSLSSAVHSVKGDLSAEAAAADNSELTLSPGEYIDFEFDGIPYLCQNRIAAVLKAVGRYEQITDEGTSGDGFAFDQNYPNPFNPATTFSFSLPVSADVNLSIFNILGQKVAEVVNGNMVPGRHEVVWDGLNTQGQLTASGIYFAKFRAGTFTNIKKIMVVK